MEALVALEHTHGDWKGESGDETRHRQYDGRRGLDVQELAERNHEHEPERDQGRSDDQTESECSAGKGVSILLLSDGQLSRDFTRDCELHRAGGKDDEGQ